MSVIIFLAVSSDGFIAAEDNNLEWFPTAEPAEGQDTGFDDLLARSSCLLMGRGTYDAVRKSGFWPYELPIFVATHRPLDEDHPDNVQAISGTLKEMLAALSEDDTLPAGDIYLDGPELIAEAIKKGLVDQATLTCVPAVLGKGKPMPELNDGPRQSQETSRKSIRLDDGSSLEQITFALVR